MKLDLKHPAAAESINQMHGRLCGILHIGGGPVFSSHRCARCKWIAVDESCSGHEMDAVGFCTVATCAGVYVVVSPGGGNPRSGDP